MDRKEMISASLSYLEKMKITLFEEPFIECLNHFYDYFIDDSGTTNNEKKDAIVERSPKRIVLNSRPGHGKTTALYCFVNYVISHTEIPLLLVFKEKNQQIELINFLRKLSNSETIDEKVSYNNSSHTINETDKCKQVLVITHARMEKIVLLKRFGINHSNSDLLMVNNKERKIFFDEEPKLFIFNSFDVNDSSWIDSKLFSRGSAIKRYELTYLKDKVKKIDSNCLAVYLRCVYSMIIAKELLLDNRRYSIYQLKRHLDNNDIRLFNEFYNVTVVFGNRELR